MKKRKILSIVFLVFVAAALFWWWSAQLPKSVDSNGAAQVSESYLASVYSLTGEAVYRKSDFGVVSPLVEGDRLSENTSIRTFENSHVVLMFTGSQDRIEVGSDSELALIKADKSIQISLLRGEAYGSFHGDRKGLEYVMSSSRLKAQTENGDLLFRVMDRGLHKIEVYRGDVVAKSGGKTIELKKDQFVTCFKIGDIKLTKQDIQIVTPLPYDRVYKTSEQEINTRTRFAWAGIERIKKIEILIGDQIDQLKPLELDESVNVNEVTASLPEGVHYWRLKATVGEKAKTKVVFGPLFKIFVQTERPVQLIEPMGFYSTLTKDRLNGILFRWANPSKLERLLLEVAKDKEFTALILRQPVVDSADNVVVNFSDGGKLYWRVNGFRHDSSELITSAAGEFEINPGEGEEPEVVFPAPGQVITSKSLRAGLVFFKWRQVGLTDYEVDIVDAQGKSIYRTYGPMSQITVPPLLAGKYKANFRIAGLAPVIREFEVVDAAVLKWKEEKKTDTDNQTIRTLSHLNWEAGPKGVSVYRIHVTPFFPVREMSTPYKEFVANATEFTPDLSEEGLYTATVQALDVNSRILSETEPLTFRWLH